MDRGSSAVECQTRNQESLGSNPPSVPFQSLGIFVLSTTPQFTRLYFAWLECFPEKLRWCWNEQVCQGVTCKRFERFNGLDTALYKTYLYIFFQEFACNGTVVEHPEYGEVIQLQGDQRQHISQFLKKVGLAREDQLKVCTC